jgi:hypothetical protein
LREPLDDPPNLLAGRLAIVELRNRLDAGEAIEDLNQPFIVGADQVRELFLGGENSGAGLIGGLSGCVNGDVVVGIDRKMLHFRLISWRGVVRDDHIHASEALCKASRICRLREKKELDSCFDLSD